MNTRPLRLLVAIAVLTLAGCAHRVHAPEAAAPAVPGGPPLRFTVEAGMNDTWNAVGQILVRTPGVAFEGRAQMMGLNAVRYRSEPLLLLARALPLSDTVATLTTEVAVATPDGALMRSDAAAELLAIIERELRAEIERVRAGLAAQAKAEAAQATKARRTKSRR